MATISAKLDAKGRQIVITDGSITAVLAIGAAIKKIEITDGTSTGKIDLQNGKIHLTDGSKIIDAALGDLPAAGEAKFRQVTVCDDGVEKIAYILMTAPQAP